MNCTFDKMIVSITFPDYLYCGFTQTFLDDFNWKLGNSETPTAGTGPIEDHTGNNKGTFCIMACMHYTVITNSNVSRSAFKCISVLNGGGFLGQGCTGQLTDHIVASLVSFGSTG